MYFLRRKATRNARFFLVCTIILAGLWATSLYSSLLFHTLAELFCVVIAATIFILAWNFRHFYRDGFLVFIGVAYLFVGWLDLLHTLAFRGMAVFPGYDTNTTVQLWVAARCLQGFSLLAAPLFLRRKVNIGWLLAGYGLLTGLTLFSIFAWRIFPTAFSAGSGITPFKNASEYVVIVALAAAIFALLRNRPSIDRRVRHWLIFSILLTMASKTVFTLYGNNFNPANLLGHAFKIAAYLMIYKAMIETEAGEIYTDITRLQATEKALRQREKELEQSEDELRSRGETFKLFIEYAPTAIAMLDRNLRYIAVSRRYLVDYRIEGQDVTGRSHYDVFPEVPERWKEIHRRCLAGAIEKCEEDPFPRADGTLDWVRWEIHPWYDSNREIGGLIFFTEVITGRKHAADALRERDRLLQDYADRLKRSNHDLEQFAFVASHDLQEPLRKIKMFCRRLEHQLGPAPAAEARDSLARMQNAAERMREMIDGLLQLSRINRSKEMFTLVELTPLVNEVMADLEARIHATGGRVLLDALPAIEADALQIRQLFQNLIGNALKFHRPGVPPTVHISATRLPTPEKGSGFTFPGNRGASPTPSRQLSTQPEKDAVKIVVEDNGIGIDPQYLESIFDPFYRLHGKNEYEGTGLGLSICKKIVERHQGKIEAQSQPGQGSTFLVTLPVRQPGG